MAEKTIEERILSAKKLLDQYTEDKIRKEEQLKSKEKQLSDLDAQLKSKGINPDKLEQILKEKEAKLLKETEDFEKSVSEVGEKLRGIQDSLDILDD